MSHMSLIDAIEHFSKRNSIPSQIAYAIVNVESNSVMTAIRYDPLYRWMWDCKEHRPFRRVTDTEAVKSARPLDFPAPPQKDWGFHSSPSTEWHAQRTAWGPFQMMGAVLREAGYTHPFPELCVDPELAARWGCRHIALLKRKYYDKHGWNGVVAAYNAGRPRAVKGQYRNQPYVDQVARAGALPFVTPS